MSRQSQNITKYFRSAVSAQANTGLEFKNEPFFIIEASQLLEGRIHSEICEKVFIEANKGSNYEDDKFKKTTINVIVSAKTVKTIYEANAKIQDDVDELTGLFFIPARMDNSGKLYFDSENKKLPWFPREYLQPMVESKLAIGSASNVDSFISDHVDQVELIGTWAQYVSFIKEFYETITNSKFEDSNILSQEEDSTSFDLERNMYLFIDNTVNSTFHILKLYNYLLHDLQLKPLYDNFTSISKVISESLIPNSTSNMQLHAGQMGGEHPLSPSQREAMNHYNHMNVGEVLAVNGPPGTGKTTLLQSIVADTYVKRAILEEKAPLIVATSTNNQAVTNIIASFGNIKKMSDSNLEDRWIEGVHSFATYFPSGSKVKEATSQGYQYTNSKGEYFLSDIETEDNLNNSRTKIIENCSEFFKSKFTNLEECRSALHKELLFFEESKRSLLALCDESNQFQHPDIPVDVQLKLLEEQMDHIQVRIQNIKDRVSQWEIVYSKIPFIIRLISRITKKNLRRIQTEFRLFISTEELAVLDESMSIGRIKEIYSQQVAELGRSFVKLKDDAELIRGWIKKYDNELKTLGEHGVILHDSESTRYNISIDTVNELIDKKIRYREFWIAVHYFECRWANGEDELTDKQKGKTFPNVLTKFYNRL
ncbi:AAA domain-containing protein [Paenibacillus sp. RC67]|uniref:AAA domain-containing protein n=1 Tax=Paenibacillus sp. RC67 TaxID=3039392 RepID=UPI0024AE3771|nr:AAA domain-containing protein [Paenibacillus sp. RC67]